MNRVVRVGSRDSLLAVKQAEIVMDVIKKNNPNITLELITIKTKGDKILDKSLDKIGGKGLFIKELEQALLNCKIDIAVHSYKDMPVDEQEMLPIVALSERSAPFDVLVLPDNVKGLDETKPIGSSSSRRSIQLATLYKNMTTLSIRGNVVSRLSKLDAGEYSALVLAQAGLERLDLRNRITRIFTENEMLPSASQGILAVQGRKGEDYRYLEAFNSVSSVYASKAERQFLKTLNGGCTSPVAAYARLSGNEIKLMGMYVDGSNKVFKDVICGLCDEAESLGMRLALSLKERAEKGW